jgi:hypothetical protein
MPTIVHTMLVRVGSMVCCGRVGSPSAGAAASGSSNLELSAGSRSGPGAAGPSALMVASLPFLTIIMLDRSSRQSDHKAAAQDTNSPVRLLR